MPSSNKTIELSPARRVCVNKCDGETAIIYQSTDDGGHWVTMATIAMSDAQADDVAVALVSDFETVHILADAS